MPHTTPTPVMMTASSEELLREAPPNQGLLRVPAAAVSFIECNIVSSESRITSLLDQLRVSEAALFEQSAQRDRWLLENAPVVKRYDALTRELWRCEQQQAIAAEVSMPGSVRWGSAYSDRPTERATWHEAVRAIEADRKRWTVTDPNEVVGSRPSSARQRDEREALERCLVETHRVNEIELDVEVAR